MKEEMPPGAIRILGLGKRYRLRAASAGYMTLRDSIAARFTSSKTSGESPNWFWALRDVDLEVRPGEVVGLIGRNGAGKTTLLKILSRITEPTLGRVLMRGRIGSLLEVGTGFHPELSGRDNIFLNGAVLGMRRLEIMRKFDDIVAFAGVERFIDTPVKRYSTGMYLRLAFAVAAELEPEVLLVDEVLAVGDLAFRRKSLGRMREIAQGGRTVIFVSHDLSSVRQLCERVVWLDRGAVLRDGPTLEVTAEYERTSVGATAIAPQATRDPAAVVGQEVWFDAVELRDSVGELCSEFNFGETIELRLHLAGRPPRDHFTIEWMIFDERGQRVTMGTANPQQEMYFDDDVRSVACIIGPLSLTSGLYRFWLSMRVWNQPPRWDTWEEAVWFRLALCDPYGTGFDNPSLSNGAVILPQEWKVLERSG